MSIDYYSNIGKSSYNLATTNLDIEIFELLALRFDFVREFINIATKPKYSPVLSIR
jgi:hypothetical protein